MEMSIPCSVCTEISENGDLWPNQKRYWSDTSQNYASKKDIEIIEAEACPDHIHMLISFSPKYSISYVMGYLKGKSSLVIFDRHANLKYKYGNRHFWARGYFVDAKESRLCKRWCRKYAVAFLYKKKNVKSYDLTFKIWCTSRDSNPGPTD